MIQEDMDSQCRYDDGELKARHRFTVRSANKKFSPMHEKRNVLNTGCFTSEYITILSIKLGLVQIFVIRQSQNYVRMYIGV